MKRILYFVLVIAICLSFFIVTLQALTPTYSVSDEYKASKYYTQLTKVELTGNQRENIVNIALSQDGYHEGNALVDLSGGNQQGAKNYTEYHKLFPKKGQGVSWCAMFVSWCARQAGIPTSIIETSFLADAGSFGASYYGRDAQRTKDIDYIPKKGDLIIFDWKENGYCTKEPASDYGDHVGIVIEDANKDIGLVKFIDGNSTTNNVRIKTYELSYSAIKGYAVPAYAPPPPKTTRTSMLDLRDMPTTSNQSEGWSWDSETKTLILDGVNIVTEDISGIRMPSGTIILHGDNTVKSICSSKDTTIVFGIWSQNGNLVFEGDGSLIVEAGTSKGGSNGISVSGPTEKGNITINSGKITAIGGESKNSSSAGIWTYNLSIDGGNLTAIGGEAKNSGSQGVYVYNGNLIVNGGILHATGGTSSGQKFSSSAGVFLYKRSGNASEVVLADGMKITTPLNGYVGLCYDYSDPSKTVCNPLDANAAAKEVVIQGK